MQCFYFSVAQDAKGLAVFDCPVNVPKSLTLGVRIPTTSQICSHPSHCNDRRGFSTDQPYFRPSLQSHCPQLVVERFAGERRFARLSGPHSYFKEPLLFFAPAAQVDRDDVIASIGNLRLAI